MRPCPARTRPPLCSGLPKAAGRRNPLARQPAGVVGGQEHGDFRDVLRLPETSQRGFGYDLLFEVAADDTCAVDAFGFHAARRDGIDTDLPRSQLLAEHA